MGFTLNGIRYELSADGVQRRLRDVSPEAATSPVRTGRIGMVVTRLFREPDLRGQAQLTGKLQCDSKRVLHRLIEMYGTAG